MRLMKRNQTAIYYCLYKGKEPLQDENGNETSEYRVLYEKPVKQMCNVSHATGYAQMNMFGNLESYDKVMIIDDMNCPIDENTVLFIDSKPSYRQGKPAYDYTVKRVAKSLNTIAYAVSKVIVS